MAIGTSDHALALHRLLVGGRARIFLGDGDSGRCEPSHRRCDDGKLPDAVHVSPLFLMAGLDVALLGGLFVPGIDEAVDDDRESRIVDLMRF